MGPCSRSLSYPLTSAPGRRAVPSPSTRPPYTTSLDDNLFQPLHPDTAADLTAGDGYKLGRGGRSKLHALHSSAALACNVFDYWRGRPLAPIAAACGADPAVTGLRFEARHPTSAGGAPPTSTSSSMVTSTT